MNFNFSNNKGKANRTSPDVESILGHRYIKSDCNSFMSKRVSNLAIKQP